MAFPAFDSPNNANKLTVTEPHHIISAQNIYFFGMKRWCRLQKYTLFSKGIKIEIFCKNMEVLQILVHHFEYLMTCDFSQETIQQRSIIK